MTSHVDRISVGSRTRDVRFCISAALILCLGWPGAVRGQSCAGDCDGDARVGVDELVDAVNIALGGAPADRCQAVDADRNGTLDIAELLLAVARSMAGCFQNAGSGAVENAARVAATNAEAVPRFQVLGFGLLQSGGGGAAARWAGFEAESGAGAGQVPIELACETGTRRVLCRNAGAGSSTRETQYLNCKLSEDGVAVIRNGFEHLTLSAPGCPAQPPPGASIEIELSAYSEVRRSGALESSRIEVEDLLTERFEPAGGPCESAGRSFTGGSLAIRGSLRTLCNPEADPGCNPSLRDLRLTSRDLVLLTSYAEPACDLTTEVRGDLTVDNGPQNESFTQMIGGAAGARFRLSERSFSGGRMLAENGQVTIDCVGEVTFTTTQELVVDADSACPSRGTLQIALAAAGRTELAVAEPRGTASLEGGGAGSVSETGGLREIAFRAANGQVYQILQNPAGNAELRTENVRITTVVGSNDGINRCDTISLSGGEAQAVVSAASGAAFPPDLVRTTEVVADASEPCFNPNGNGGDGLACLGASCGEDCRCRGGGCVTFSISDGVPLSQAPRPGGQLVESLSPLSGPCSGVSGRSTYAFGTPSPTLASPLCAAPPADGFTLAPGRSVIFAYPAPPAVDFFTGSAGFPIDVDGDNTRGCAANAVITGVANRNELGPAQVTFVDGAVQFDVNADAVVDRLLGSCRELSIAECGAPPPTPTATPVLQPVCPDETAATGSAPPDSTADALDRVGGASCGDGGNSAPERAFRFTAPASACYRIDTLDTTGLAAPFDTLLYVRRGQEDCEGTELACNDNAGIESIQSQIFVALRASQQIVVVVDGSNGAHGDFRLRITEAGSDCPVDTVTPTPSATPASPTPTSTPTRTPMVSRTPTPTSTRTPPPRIVEILQGIFFNSPRAVAVDGARNFYVAANGSDNVFKVTPTGEVTVILDSSGDGAGNALKGPTAIAVDGFDNVYVAGEQSDNVFRVAPDGDVARIIGPQGDGEGHGLNAPKALAVDGAGNVFVAGDFSNNVLVFRTSPEEAVQQVIDQDGDGVSPLSSPAALATDGAGNVYVAGGGSDNVFKITPSGGISQILGPEGDGGTNPLSFPTAVAVDGASNVFVAGSQPDVVFRRTPSGSVNVIIEARGDGNGNELDQPIALAVDGANNVYVAGRFSDNVFRVNPAGTIVQILDSSGDDMGHGLIQPISLAVDSARNVFVAGIFSDNVFRVGVGGGGARVLDQALAGNDLRGPSALAVDVDGGVLVTGFTSNNAFRIDAKGPVAQIIDSGGDGAGSRLNGPNSLATDGARNVFVGGAFDPETHNYVFRINPNGAIITILDSNGDNRGHSFSVPGDIAVDGTGNAYVTGALSDNVFKVTPSGTITQIIDVTGDGEGNRLATPVGVAVGREGDVYVTGFDSNNAFRIAPEGAISEILDSVRAGFPVSRPVAIALDAAGNVFVAARDSDNVFKISTDAQVTRILDSSGDGVGHGLAFPNAISTDAAGNVFVSGGESHNAFKITPGGLIEQIIDSTGDGRGNRLLSPDAIAADASGNVYIAGFDTNNVFRISAD